MNAIVAAPPSDSTRARAIILACAFAALASGVFTALSAEQSSATILVAFVFCVAALLLPLSWLALVLAALIPLQFYFPFAGSLNLRGALVFVAIAALRVLVMRVLRPDWQLSVSGLRSRPWLIPAALFLVTAFIAALTAPNRYIALKGIYDWLPIFATAFVVGETVQPERLVKQIIAILIAVGIGEAALGLVQATLDVPRIVRFLQLPFSALVYQPSLLRDRLSDLSFNWIAFDRVLPFGTFINGIDYAIFLAAILTLTLALLLGEGQTTADHQLPTALRITHGASRYARLVGLLICAALLGSALLQTLKGSGMIALAGGVGAIALLYARRLSPRVLAMGALVLIVAFALAVPFYDELARRVVFLIQREIGAIMTSGRTAIWAQLLAYLPQRPWFGFGLNNTPLLVTPLPSLSAGTFVFNIPAAESAYVAALVETGIIGFAALMLFIGVILVRAYRNAQSARAMGIAAAMIAIFCGSLTVVGLTTDQNGMLLGVLIGLVFASVNERGRF